MSTKWNPKHVKNGTSDYNCVILTIFFHRKRWISHWRTVEYRFLWECL